MKIWAIALVLAFGFGSAHAELKWERQRVDLSPGPTDQFVDATFNFVNSGKGSVTIEKLESSCGCTTASLPKMTFDPGERSQVMTRFNTTGRRGVQTKTVTVRIKGETKPVILMLVVSIPDLVKIEPPLVIWENGEEAKPKAISIQAMNGYAVKIAKVISSEPTVKVTIETIRESQQYAIVVTPYSTATPSFSVLTISADYNGDKPVMSAYAQVRRARQ